MNESKPVDLEAIADLCDRRLNGFASIEHESQLMDVVPALCAEVEALRERLRELKTRLNIVGE